MHPLREELIRYVDGSLNESSIARVQEHIDRCEFCRRFVENYRLFGDSLVVAAGEAIPPRALELADRLYRQVLAGRVIGLEPLMSDGSQSPLRLAADGEREFEPRVQNLSTFCSENPEIVLRVMRDLVKEQDYLQLISDNPALSANVMVQVPELDLELITDNNGRAVLEKGSLVDPQQLTWKIKVPDASFLLQPLVYNPDKTEYSKSLMLETEEDDKIEVTFEGKTEGKQISVRVLKLDGKSDFGPIKVCVSQRDTSVVKDVCSHERCCFTLVDANDGVSIRLFQLS